MLLRDIPLKMLPKTSRRMVDLILRQRPTISVEAVLRTHHLGPATKKLLRDLLAEASPREEDPFDDLERWLARHRLTGLLDLPLRELSSAVRDDWEFNNFSQYTLRDLNARATGYWYQNLRDEMSRELWVLADSVNMSEAIAHGLIARLTAAALPDVLQEARPVLVNAATDLMKQHAPVLQLTSPPAVETGPFALAARSGRLEFEPAELVLSDTAILGLASLLCLMDFLLADSPARAELVAALQVPRWERLLKRLDRVLPVVDEVDDKPLLGWLLHTHGYGPTELRPVHCRKTKRGPRYVLRQAEVRRVPHHKLTEPGDRRALQLLTAGSDFEHATEALIGHPRVFVDKAKVPTAVRRGRLSLGVRTHEDGCVLQLELDGEPVSFAAWKPLLREADSGVLVSVEPDAVVVCDLPRETRALLIRLEPLLGTTFPEEARAGLLARLPALNEVTPLNTDTSIRGARVTGDRRPVARLTWDTERLEVQLLLAPLPELATLVPGQGSEVLYVARDGETVHLVRDLEAEAARFETLAHELNLPHAVEGSPFHWQLSDLQQAIGLVDRLGDHTEQFRVTWHGPRVRVAGRMQTSDLSLRVDSSRDWFQVSGGVEVDGHKVDLSALMEAALANHSYVQIAPDKWVELGDTLRAALSATASVSGKRAQVSPLHAPMLEALEQAGASLQIPTAWRDLSTKAREAVDYQAPLPDTLVGTLRPYQLEGFRWLASLQRWAPGACLADDMGLGKTIQALALLLHVREQGPCLVVAPTSVCFNWAREAARFSPCLRIHHYRGGERTTLLSEIGPGDVLITSYGILTRDAEELAGVSFSIVILDEAQAIKNPGAARTRAAMSLDAGFRLALSGTPVENRVAELYSLMGFVAPGLLGPPGVFSERFIGPIEARGDTDRRSLLARLVSPFVLRRTKGRVAKDLPERVEHIYRVEPSTAERALYERHRLEAVVRMETSGGDARFQVLQELQHLRQLACHPRMVDPGSPIPSSKLTAVVRLLGDLRESGHRALVFSSFTKHLALVREALQDEGFTLCYLDGSTTLPRREAEVDRFQDGEGDVFLISLKAGGTGLNLTAATYVVHLDPWWNPAAEDQATDRAHRIGQDRKVTVYRMVTTGTIEEQIVQLHAHKRDLASALMAGSGEANRVTAEDLMRLLQQAEDDTPAELQAPPTSPAAIQKIRVPDEPPLPERHIAPPTSPAATQKIRVPEEPPLPERHIVPPTQVPKTRGHRGRTLPPTDRPDLATLADFVGAYVRHLEADRDAGLLREASCRNYANVLIRAAPHGPDHALGRAACVKQLAALQPRVEAGELGTKSDRKFAKTVFNRMRAWLEA